MGDPRCKFYQPLLVAAVAPLGVMLPFVPAFQFVVRSIVPTLEPLVQPVILTMCHAAPMRPIVLPLEAIVVSVVPLFKAVVLIIVAIAPFPVISRGRTGQADRHGCAQKRDTEQSLLRIP